MLRRDRRVSRRHFVAGGASIVAALAIGQVAHAESVKKTIPIGGQPYWTALDIRLNRIYVVGPYGGTVIDGATNTVVSPWVSWQQIASDVAVDSLHGRVYVSDGMSAVHVFDRAFRSPVTTIQLPGIEVHNLVVNARTGLLYVSGTVGGPQGGRVWVVDCRSLSLVANLTLGIYPTGMAVDPWTNQIYVTDSYAPDLTVIDGSTNQVIATIPMDEMAERVALNPRTKRAYVPAFYNYVVQVIDTTSNLVVSTVPVGGAARGISVDEVANLVYVASLDDDNVAVIDGKTNVVLESLAVGTAPEAVVANSVTGRVYVANYEDSTVSVIQR